MVYGSMKASSWTEYHSAVGGSVKPRKARLQRQIASNEFPTLSLVARQTFYWRGAAGCF